MKGSLLGECLSRGNQDNEWERKTEKGSKRASSFDFILLIAMTPSGVKWSPLVDRVG